MFDEFEQVGGPGAGDAKPGTISTAWPCLIALLVVEISSYVLLRHRMICSVSSP